MQIVNKEVYENEKQRKKNEKKRKEVQYIALEIWFKRRRRKKKGEKSQTEAKLYTVQAILERWEVKFSRGEFIVSLDIYLGLYYRFIVTGTTPHSSPFIFTGATRM